MHITPVSIRLYDNISPLLKMQVSRLIYRQWSLFGEIIWCHQILNAIDIWCWRWSIALFLYYQFGDSRYLLDFYSFSGHISCNKDMNFSKRELLLKDEISENQIRLRGLDFENYGGCCKECVPFNAFLCLW